MLIIKVSIVQTMDHVGTAYLLAALTLVSLFVLPNSKAFDMSQYDSILCKCLAL